MDFTPLTSTPEQKRRTRTAVLGAAALTSGLLSTVPILIFTGTYDSEAAMTNDVLFFGTLLAPMLGFLGIPATAFISSDMKQRRKRERTEALRFALGKHYDLALSASELAALNYPLDEPTEAFQVYGSIIKVVQVSDSTFVERKIYLVFMDGELKLSSSKDGKRFRELPQARPELPATPTQASSIQISQLVPNSISA